MNPVAILVEHRLYFLVFSRSVTSHLKKSIPCVTEGILRNSLENRGACCFGSPLSSQNACLSSAFSGEETKKSPGGHIWAVGRLRKRWDADLGQVDVHNKGGVSRGVVVVQLPVGCDVLSDPADP
ncbi:unnamed protein product [Acanthoscelides obtectus]|uniref:Uncharacterized protein n=1 Tax=Acanthoscelides obtectus TaxID=200917 RepID=A0A9P0JYE9_ACAOB|nr:unnamed protein product [Acanthoscelides obtectus]CAK1648707.1 hypothetical protein AOBTE_LOCUS15833 [Acanthoscelides obtectus]